MLERFVRVHHVPVGLNGEACIGKHVIVNAFAVFIIAADRDANIFVCVATNGNATIGIDNSIDWNAYVGGCCDYDVLFGAHVILVD
jgi:hypothetical protein